MLIQILTPMALVLSFCVATCAKDKHAPLPEEIIAAKTIYMDNKTGHHEVGDRAYNELLKWGRYRVVQKPGDADVILLLSMSASQAGEVTTGTITANTDASGATTGTVQSKTAPVSQGLTAISLVDAKTGDTLWSDSRVWGYHFKSATRGLIQELRKRVEEQEKSAGK